MRETNPKHDLHHYLQAARETLLWKLDGLSEYDIRRPMVQTGTNLLGLVKHVASLEAGFLGETFGRPFREPLPWFDPGAEPNADMWAAADQSREQITGLYRRVWAHSDATIEALALDATGQMPWWPPEQSAVTLNLMLVHMIAETNRHAGHADIVRELIDGEIGWRAGDLMLIRSPGREIGVNQAAVEPSRWESYRVRLEDTARRAGRLSQTSATEQTDPLPSDALS